MKNVQIEGGWNMFQFILIFIRMGSVKGPWRYEKECNANIGLRFSLTLATSFKYSE